MSACDLGRGIADGVIDAEALTSRYLEAIRECPETGNIYARISEDRAMAEARLAANRQHSHRRMSQLDGVPVSWKDLFDTSNVATEAGSLIYKDRIPDRDAASLSLAKNAGMVCLGKTHMSEFAFSGLGLNPRTATPTCIHDNWRVAGGSSSGAAASVANGLAAAGMGTDTGGSVRVPAAWNDLVGMKTTYGRIPLKGVVPLCDSFDSIGPICRTVEDATAMTAILFGINPPDLAGCRLKDRVFLIPECNSLVPVEEDPQTAFNEAVDLIRSCGARVERKVVNCIDHALEQSAACYCAEAYASHGKAIGDRWDLVFWAIRDRVASGREISAADYILAMKEIGKLRVQFRSETIGYDGVLLPASPVMPPRIDRLLSDRKYMAEYNLHALRNTRIANLMDVPALTLPTGTPSTGLMIMGHRNEDIALLGMGTAMESALRDRR